ncbi:PucR family transcriptional regulator [Halobacillus naozhouensis]|uniref:Helix-turn-helix domain-containing protein n=1 Tax=Halobacillus naozhouensis TaxID=554880 RepID=A0ABY8J0N0_9BACI|nr:helix-turn-helix domain-containing protein [Halobacillus naozhouensis]WFT76048.1 helix-turn-helix domain-containing protein [Halobacillus naozhouensis]
MTKIEQLKQIYPSLITVDEQDIEPSNKYQIFHTDEDQVIAILKTELNQREVQLLHLVLTPIPQQDDQKTDREQAWSSYILGHSDKFTAEPLPKKFRFVFFSLSDPNLDRQTFREALQSLFPRVMPLLWENHQQGVIIEEIMENNQETITFQPLIDVLMSDFYTKIHFYVSEFSEFPTEAPPFFQWAEKCFHTSMRNGNGPVATFQDVIPSLYIEAMPEAERTMISDALFASVRDDRELLQTIQIFLESGSNATLAAKRLYMHRNSLQYRVDKFIEKTGVDIKQFQGAVVTYLSLLETDK